MILSYFLILTPSFWADKRAFASSLTVKPRMIAPEAEASITSAYEISPTPTWIIFVTISFDSKPATAWETASAAPCVFAFIIKSERGIKCQTSPLTKTRHLDLMRRYGADFSIYWRNEFAIFFFVFYAFGDYIHTVPHNIKTTLLAADRVKLSVAFWRK